MLEQPISHLVCRQDVYLKNSVNWEMVRGDVTGLNENRILWSPFPVSSLSEALFCVISDRMFKPTSLVRTRDKP